MEKLDLEVKLEVKVVVSLEKLKLVTYSECVGNPETVEIVNLEGKMCVEENLNLVEKQGLI